jgi:hypothetical protein
MGPAGLDLASISTKTVLETGIADQVRAGRQLTLADFNTLCALPTVPVGLFNLGDLSNLGSGGALTNKGAVTFGSGIAGAVTEAAIFIGSTAQALYIADTGAADPYRLLTGTFGCWFRVNKKGVTQRLFNKWTTTSRSWSLAVLTTGVVQVEGSVTGVGDTAATGTTDVADGRWHLAVGTFDGSAMRVYIDGTLEATTQATGTLAVGNSPLNIGGREASGATAAIEPVFGRVDEAFVTHDVLSADQIRLLSCAKLPHGLGDLPKHVVLSFRKRRKGPKMVSADFPAAPVRLYNLEDLLDLGSNNVSLTANPGTGAIVQVAGPDGSKNTARSYSGAHTGDTGTDAGLPSGLNARSYGFWIKTTTAVAAAGVLSWGTAVTATRVVVVAGVIRFDSGAQNQNGPAINDGLWHHVVGVEDNTDAAGIKRKFFVDGKLVATNTLMDSLTLGGAGFFKIGCDTGPNPFIGQLSRVFVYAGVLTPEQIGGLYAKGGQVLASAPENPGDYVEAFDVNNLYVNFAAVQSQHQADLAVAV